MEREREREREKRGKHAYKIGNNPVFEPCRVYEYCLS